MSFSSNILAVFSGGGGGEAGFEIVHSVHYILKFEYIDLEDKVIGS